MPLPLIFLGKEFILFGLDPDFRSKVFHLNSLDIKIFKINGLLVK